jgi:hypothetical protein
MCMPAGRPPTDGAPVRRAHPRGHFSFNSSAIQFGEDPFGLRNQSETLLFLDARICEAPAKTYAASSVEICPIAGQ